VTPAAAAAAWGAIAEATEKKRMRLRLLPPLSSPLLSSSHLSPLTSPLLSSPHFSSLSLFLHTQVLGIFVAQAVLAWLNVVVSFCLMILIWTTYSVTQRELTFERQSVRYTAFLSPLTTP